MTERSTIESPSATAVIATSLRHEDGDANDGVTRYFQVRGKVQNVMFRQTVIRAMLKRELTGGATNDKADKKLVHVTLRGANQSIQELTDTIGSGQQLNDWGAMATSMTEVEKAQGKSVASHQVTTANVGMKQWNPNCTMFI